MDIQCKFSSNYEKEIHCTPLLVSAPHYRSENPILPNFPAALMLLMHVQPLYPQISGYADGWRAQSHVAEPHNRTFPCLAEDWE